MCYTAHDSPTAVSTMQSAQMLAPASLTAQAKLDTMNDALLKEKSELI